MGARRDGFQMVSKRAIELNRFAVGKNELPLDCCSPRCSSYVCVPSALRCVRSTARQFSHCGDLGMPLLCSDAAS
jgi:hypothetical protein